MPDTNYSPLFGASMRSPPANLEAEQALLGALIANNKAHDRVAEFLKPEHFADPINGRIYREIGRLIGSGHIADGVTLKGAFEGSGDLSDVGGTPYIARLMGSMVGIINAVDYGHVILDAAIRRELIDIGEQLVNRSYDRTGATDVSVLARETAGKIDLAASASPSLNGILGTDEAMNSATDAMDNASLGGSGGISTGFRCFDTRLGGLEPGLMYVIAGRPSMGKSSIATQIAINIARSGVGVLEFSLEMSAQQIGRRVLSTASGVPIMAMKTGAAARDTKAAGHIVAARRELAGLPFFIDDTAGQTANQIAAKARFYRRKHRIGLILIDHLNLVRPEETDAKHGGTWSVERASGTILQIAKDCECPVVLLSQLNRGVEGREDKRPGLADLRQAGAIEQDAYAVGFVYRPEYYLGGEPEPKDTESPARLAERRQAWLDQRESVAGRAELIWAKVRDGEPGTDVLHFHGPTATFSEAT